MKTILEYLKHDSTWKGIFTLLTAAGVVLKPELQAAILAVGLSSVGLIQVFITDSDVEK